MTLKISYKVGKVVFDTIVNNISEAYEYIKAIINKEEIFFPNQYEALSNYMEILVQFKCNGAISHDNHIFKIQKIDEEDK